MKINLGKSYLYKNKEVLKIVLKSLVGSNCLVITYNKLKIL